MKIKADASTFSVEVARTAKSEANEVSPPPETSSNTAEARPGDTSDI